MNPVEKGKHCDACSKTVIDFSTMDTDEIKHFFKDKTTQKQSICGHFKAEQVIVKRPWHHQILVDLHAYIDTKIQFKVVRKLALSSLSIGFMLIGCNQPLTGEKMAMANSGGSNQNDSIDNRLMIGEIQLLPDSIPTKQQKDSSNVQQFKLGKVECAPIQSKTTPIDDEIDSLEFLMGDIDIYPSDTIEE